MTKIAYEWIERAIDKHFRSKAFAHRYDYDGIMEFNKGLPHNYQGDAVVIVIIPCEELGFKRPTVRVDICFGKSTNYYKEAYDGYADVVLRFRISEAMKPNNGIEEYIQLNLLPLEVSGGFEIGI